MIPVSRCCRATVTSTRSAGDGVPPFCVTRERGAAAVGQCVGSGESLGAARIALGVRRDQEAECLA